MLYAPAEDSAMPAYRFLFDEVKVVGQVSDDALNLDAPTGYQIVPTERARSLVAYLAYRNDTYAYPETNFVPTEPEAESDDEAAETEEGH